LSRRWQVAADFVAWAVIQGGLGWLVNTVPEPCFAVDGWLWRERHFEDGGRLYLRLGIRRWKGLLPDGASLVPRAARLRRLESSDPAYLCRFVAATRRAELNHLLVMACTPVFGLWNPPWAMPLLAGYALAANAPCVVTQRYNRIRLRRVVARQSGLS
jgi:glycosyl-4,4'-diaponeurosporenoate acyltransferase